VRDECQKHQLDTASKRTVERSEGRSAGMMRQNRGAGGHWIGRPGANPTTNRKRTFISYFRIIIFYFTIKGLSEDYQYYILLYYFYFIQ
jgi:hypothetical protein